MLNPFGAQYAKPSESPFTPTTTSPSSVATSDKSARTSANTVPTVDLAQPVYRQQLAAKIKAAINNYCATAYDDGHRNHLGASVIGRECSRELWYIFRWVKQADFVTQMPDGPRSDKGRMLRLFNRGHREEERWAEWLEGIGCKVVMHDEHAPLKEDGTKPQIRVSGVHGHYGGSVDGEVMLPPEFGISEPVIFNGEFKTFAVKPFSALVTEGVRVKKHDHFCQMSTYGWKRGRKYGIYFAINKNDDDLHIEVVELDWALAQRLEAKAEKIITSPLPPPKLSETITFTKCAYCDMREVCHKGAEYERNCRSCINATPIEGGQWGCKRWNAVIPKDAIPLACPEWTAAR